MNHRSASCGALSADSSSRVARSSLENPGAVDPLDVGLVSPYWVGIADEVLLRDLQLAGLHEHGQVVQQRRPKRPGPQSPREDVRDRDSCPRVTKEHRHDRDERRGRGVDAALVQHRGIKVADRTAAGFQVITDQRQQLPWRIHSRPVGMVKAAPINLEQRRGQRIHRKIIPPELASVLP